MPKNNPNILQLRKEIFQQGSRTYFYASKFFTRSLKKEVSILYAFVRRADDYVDTVPADKDAFLIFKNNFNSVWQGQVSDNWIINDFVTLAKSKGILKEWIDAFLAAMESDLNSIPYQTLQDTEKYIYGSAEVIGLMMAKLMNLSPASYPGARLLGKAMQYINFIRDLKEDETLGRQYLPQQEASAYGLENLKTETVNRQPHNFNLFLQAQIKKYEIWQQEAEQYYHYIPLRFLIPIKTAATMYQFTANQIKEKPLIVFEKKVKPEIYFVVFCGLRITLTTLWNKYFPLTKKE